MKRSILLILCLMLSSALIAGIPHPVFVEYTGSPESFEAYLASDITFFLEDTSVGCGILDGYSLLMVECGNFPIWALDDVLYIVMTDDDYGQDQWCEVTLTYDNVQALTGVEAVWNDGTPGGGGLIQSGVFAPGWNLWSYNVGLTSNVVTDVFGPMSFLTKVKSITQSYDPNLGSGFNTLNDLVDGYGYWVQVSEEDVLELTGEAIPLSTTIALEAGWNLVAYLPQDGQAPEDAFASLIANGYLEKVKSITQSYDPDLGGGFNTLDLMLGGNGFWVNVNTAVADFVYPAGRTSGSETAIEYIWTPVIYTNSTCAYANLAAEGQIAAFAGEECRGVSQITDGCVSLVINGEDAETVTFKLYQNGQVSDLNTEITTAPGEDVFFEFTSDAPIATQLLNAYPNPFNPETTIAYQLSDAGNVNISVYNIKGQKVAELMNSNHEAGDHSVVWQAAGQASGIYFVKMRTNGMDQIQKLILMK
jgi:type IX secretion system substrate protein